MNNIKLFKLSSVRNTASYIYTRDDKGIYYFALTRKIPLGGRIRKKPNLNTGAAGTKPKYMGKWGSFGGKKDRKSRHDLHASILEIRDEGNIKNLSHKNNVYLDKKTRYNNQLLVLRKATKINKSTILFIYKIPDYKKFFYYFPKFPNKRGGQRLVVSSHGEIDYVSSFTMKQIINLQNREILRKNNNFFLSYFCNTFNKYIINNLSKNFIIKYKTGIRYVQDLYGRKIIIKKKYYY